MPAEHVGVANSGEPVLLEFEGGIARLRFNRPDALNAADEDMARAFLAACRALAQRTDLRVVVLSGEGRAFLAGGDLGRFHADLPGAADTARRIIAPLHEAMLELAALPQPVIASLHGAVAGAGLSIALACDLAIAASNTSFTPAYGAIGTSPDGSLTWTLPRVVGMRKALELLLTGQRLDAQQAMELGLVNQVVAPEALETATMELAQRLAAGPTYALGQTKQLLRTSINRSLAEQLDAEAAGFAACASTQDFAEGVNAFFEKRAPHFRGG